MGVDIPEDLEAVLEQDEATKQKFDVLTIGKKRSVIFSVNKLKNIDKQIETVIKLIQQGGGTRRKEL